MPLRCESKAAVLQPPEGGLQFNDPGALSTTPFTLSGAPMNNRPEGVKGLSEFRRKPKATTNFALPDIYFDRRNYYEIYLDTENILEGNANTTLRYEGLTFTLLFGALHRGIWDTKRPEFSLFFTSSANHFFHICIPVEYSQTTENQNPFLSAWLTNAKIPSGFTINDIFALGPSIEMGIFQYCLDYNKGKNTATYTFVMCNTPAILASTKLPKWLQQDPNFTKPTKIPGENDTAERYRRTTFDQILNYMMRGNIRKWIADKPDPYLVSDDIYFDGVKQQNVIRPLYAKVPSEELSNRREKKVEGFVDQPTTLKNIKCYPIDLQTQVTSEGKVEIDEKGNIIPISEAKQKLFLENLLKPEGTETLNTIRYYLVAIIVFLVLSVVIIGTIFWIFRSRSSIEIVEVSSSPAQKLLNQIKSIITNTQNPDVALTELRAKLNPKGN